MKLTDRLFEKVQQIWESYNQHEFVRGIANGTLEKSKFRFYLIQDYLYLLDYAKVFAYGVIKSKSEKNMKFFADCIQGVISSETDIHKNYMKILDIREDELTKPTLTTTSYTKYMIGVAATEGAAEIAVAVLACSWSYLFIARNIVAEQGNSDFYAEWVNGYASDEYAEANDVIINLVNNLCVDYTEEQILNLEDILVNCSKYEYMFWDMAWNMR